MVEASFRSEVERKLEALERLVNERLGDLTRQLGTDGQLEGRIEQLEETLGTRLSGVERVVRAELDNRLGAMAERLGQVEQSLGGDETGAKLVALEATVRRRLTNLEEAVRSDDVPDRLGRLERTLAEAVGGADGLGVTTMRCATCHQAANFDAGHVPGNPKWQLAPVAMAWQKRTLGQICEQVKDPARNGGHRLPEIVEHMAKDELVGWAWKPGAGREPAPGTQPAFGALVKAWGDAGAACPTP